MAYSLVKVLEAGRSTQKESDRSFCRKWATNQAKAWARMLKVGISEKGYVIEMLMLCYENSTIEFLYSALPPLIAAGIVNPIEAKVRKGKGAVGAYGNERTQQSLQDFPVVDSEEEEEKVYPSYTHCWIK